MFIIQRLWYCPLENRDPIAWHTVGYVTTQEEADRITSLEMINTSSQPYPLETYFGKNKVITPSEMFCINVIVCCSFLRFL